LAEAVVDGFRNYVDDQFAGIAKGVAPEEMFLDKRSCSHSPHPNGSRLVGG